MLATENDAVLDAPADDGAKIDEALLSGERAQTVRAAMACLPHRWQHPIDMLMSDLPRLLRGDLRQTSCRSGASA